MYAKLAIRNVKRSMGDYAIYVLTLVLSITLIFAYNSLLFSDAINSFSKLMRPMMSILVCVTVMVVLILGWLITYITHFDPADSVQEEGKSGERGGIVP